MKEMNLEGCLSMIGHHVALHKADLFFGGMVGDIILGRIQAIFELLRVEAGAASSQVNKIRKVATEKGYDDIIALLDEKFECG